MKIAQPTPELPVRDVVTAQNYFRDRLGFRVEWYDEEGEIGAVSHGGCSIFFRGTNDTIHPGKFWIFTENIDDAYAELSERGAKIIEGISNKPWGLRQFTVCDLNENIFYFFHDI